MTQSRLNCILSIAGSLLFPLLFSVDGVGLTIAILRLLLHAAIFAGLKRFHDMPLCFVVQLELASLLVTVLTFEVKVDVLRVPHKDTFSGSHQRQTPMLLTQAPPLPSLSPKDP
ncbi:hypothetical protein DFH08DRAFT_1071530 [Mycena albidolilacea]|uniref:Uncharacterized protein n=1 Tax=Mycena albidolilacea TaxID=1033008 RepID=A0AAD7AVT2_9AGAR|nr:hypothetical protein DFH08DRAFT_1071530 [Mycena albidolilacea]